MRIVKLSVMLLLCTFSTFTLAAYHKARSRPIPPNKPVGFYLGIGIGTASVTASHSNVSMEQGGDTYAPIAYKATVNKLFPMIQIGYWGNFSKYPCWMWGVKAFYKYLGMNVNYVLMNDGGGDTAIYDSHDVSISHETGILASLGFQYTRRLYPYFGLGLMWLPKVDDIFHNSSYDFLGNKSMLGLLAQIGFIYTLTPKWYLDTVYIAGVSGSRKFENVDEDVGAITILRRNVRIISQEIMFSVNRRFRL
jgi:opacity protein-like surface antigen